LFPSTADVHLRRVPPRLRIDERGYRVALTFAADLAKHARRGRDVGLVATGALVGVLLGWTLTGARAEVRELEIHVRRRRVAVMVIADLQPESCR